MHFAILLYWINVHIHCYNSQLTVTWLVFGALVHWSMRGNYINTKLQQNSKIIQCLGLSCIDSRLQQYPTLILIIIRISILHFCWFIFSVFIYRTEYRTQLNCVDTIGVRYKTVCCFGFTGTYPSCIRKSLEA